MVDSQINGGSWKIKRTEPGGTWEVPETGWSNRGNIETSKKGKEDEESKGQRDVVSSPNWVPFRPVSLEVLPSQG